MINTSSYLTNPSSFTVDTYGPVWYVLALLLVIPLIKHFMQGHIDNYFNASFSRKKANVWKNRIDNNDYVQKSLQSYGELGSNKFYRIYPFLIIGVVLGSFIPIFIAEYAIKWTYIGIFILSLNQPIDKLLSIVIPSGFLIFAFIIVILADKILKQFKGIGYADLINKYNSILNKSVALISFTVAFSIIYLLYFSVLFRRNIDIEDYFVPSILIFVCVGILLFVVLISTIFNLRLYKDRIKRYLNKVNGKGYPIVKAITVNNNVVNGRFKDPFDSTFLVLKNATCQEMILWSSIDSLSIIYESDLNRPVIPFICLSDLEN